MAGRFQRILLGVAGVLAVGVTIPAQCRGGQDPAPRAPAGERRAGALDDADGPVPYALPKEEAPPLFVPLHPQTVEERQLIDAVTQYSAARAFEHQNLWADSIELLEKALALEPDSAAILKRLSRLCLALGKIDQGIKYGKRALDADPGDSDIISELVAHYAKNDPAAAVSLLKDVLANPRLERNSPGYLLAQLELGKLYSEELKQIDRAADAFAIVLLALDEKATNRLSPADQKRILGGDELAAAATYRDFGLVFLKAKRYDLAIQAFHRGLVYDEEDAQLPLLLAQTLLKAGKGEEALRRVEEYLKRQPQGPEGYELLARILTELHREDEITPRLEAAVKADSKNILLRYILADRYREVGQVERAEQMYKALLAEQPSSQGYGALAASLYKRKKYEELLRVMSEAITKPGGAEAIAPQLDAVEHDPAAADQILDAGLKLLSAEPSPPNSQATLRILTHIASRAEKFDKLVALERLLLKQNPSPLAYRGMASTLFRLHRYAEAAATLDELLARYPDERNAGMLVELANFRRLADQNEAALDAARQALRLDPTDAQAQLLAVILLSQTGKADEAVATARAALKDDPSNVDMNRYLGYVLNQFGRTQEAIALYKDLLERYPNNRELVRMARSGLSVAYITINEYAKGEAELEILLQLEPDEPGVNNDLGYLYADQGKHLEKAEAMIRKAVQEDPESSAYLDSLGWVLFKRGRIKEAVEPLEKAVQNLTGGGDATIYEHLGDVYFQLQDIPKARAAWEQAERAAAKAVPPDRRLPEIRKKLESLDKLGPTPKPGATDTP
jgi:tetratricopeptide (TPR) repeat protein